MADPPRPSSATGHASDFYYACRIGDFDKVERILKTYTKRDIDRVEPSNNSTALHAATFYGHTHIVQLLLSRGASTTTLNGYGNTAEQEASTEEMKRLYRRYANS